MQEMERNEAAEILLVISAEPRVRLQVEEEFTRRRKGICILSAEGIAGARQLLDARSPSVILLDEICLVNGSGSNHGGKPTLGATVTSLAQSAPVVVMGRAEHQSELTALLACGAADYVACSESALEAAIGLVERRLRQSHSRPCLTMKAAKAEASLSPPSPDPLKPRDFGEVLRHELNNPLTGILGNAELLLVELRRKNIELPPTAEVRLETIASLAVRMRERVRRLSEEWERNAEKTHGGLVERHQ